MFQKIAEYLAKTEYVRKTLEEPADLKDIGNWRSTWTLMGIILIGFSYIIGWPAVAALGVLAVYFREPLIVAIGGPVIYGFSHVVFLAGVWLVGARHARLLMRYATKQLFRKILRRGTEEPPASGAPENSGKS